ncbi:MATH and LRR domain-containing protein PFE0570w-like [Hydra vulgaris]|uniref:MATH and LRR domain-containing protein PFE0570w-like n=1 Tax=Hydra vulgaris TaxID=6087 RepID=A0ABM4BMY9_HYDVU
METNLLSNFNAKNYKSNNNGNNNDINKLKAFLRNKNILFENNPELNISFFKDGDGEENISPYYYNSNISTLIGNIDVNALSILHLNIRSIQKNFDKFKEFLFSVKIKFQIICLTETWCRNKEIKNNSNFQLNNYKVIHQIRGSEKIGGGVCIFIHNSLDFKLRKEMCSITKDFELLTVEVLNDASKNVILHVIYRPPSGNIKAFSKHFKGLITKKDTYGKLIYCVSDLNLDFLDYENNKNVRNLTNIIFQNGFIPTINKPTRITKNSATLIDQIIINNFKNIKVKTGIFVTDISDHFPVFIISQKSINKISEKKEIKKRIINNTSTMTFMNLLSTTNWETILKTKNAQEAYNIFHCIFQDHYNEAFPIISKLIKTKSHQNPWITAGIIKSSQKKKRLYEKFIKKRTYKNETKYENYKRLFETVIKDSKKQYYTNQLHNCKNDAQKMWRIMKEVIGKKNISANELPKKLIINNCEITNETLISNSFNHEFVNTGPSLASKVKNSKTSFESYLTSNNDLMENNKLSEQELLDAVNLLKSNKGNGVDDVSSNIIIKSIFYLKTPLLHIFSLSLEQGIFPDKLKVARVIPVLKSGDATCVANYRPISLLPCFSKILEHIMYKR